MDGVMKIGNFVAAAMQYILLSFVLLFQLIIILFDKAGISLFYSSLTAKPEYWWPLASFDPWILQIGFIVFVFVVFKTLLRAEPKWAIPVVAISLLATFTLVYFNLQLGVAVFDNELLVRKFSFAHPVSQRYLFSNVKRSEVDCEIDNGRGSITVTANTSYNLAFNDGRQFDLHDGVDMNKYSGSWLLAVSAVDKALLQHNVRPILNSFRSKQDYQKCLALFVSDKDANQIKIIDQVFTQ